MPRPTPKLDDHPLSAVPDFLFSLFAATLHIGGLLHFMEKLGTDHVFNFVGCKYQFREYADSAIYHAVR